MSHSKRLCDRKARPEERPGKLNYSNSRAFQKAKTRRDLQKAGRKAARRH